MGWTLEIRRISNREKEAQYLVVEEGIGTKSSKEERRALEGALGKSEGPGVRGAVTFSRKPHKDLFEVSIIKKQLHLKIGV